MIAYVLSDYGLQQDDQIILHLDKKAGLEEHVLLNSGFLWSKERITIILSLILEVNAS